MPSRIETAIEAALAVASRQGLRVADAVAVGTGSNVIVHLRPAPVVARVMSGTQVLHADPRVWLQRELDVVRHLRACGAPVVAPTELCDAGPFEHAGVWLSLWEFEPVVERPVTGEEIGRCLRALHDALVTYRGPLEPRAAVWEEIAWLLARVGDRGLEREARRLRPLTASIDDRAQPLHGDASVFNLLTTGRGLRWNDFEDVCVGAVEWDLAGVESSARLRYGDAVAAEVRSGYGREVDDDVLAVILAVQELYATAWQRYLATVR